MNSTSTRRRGPVRSGVGGLKPQLMLLSMCFMCSIGGLWFVTSGGGAALRSAPTDDQTAFATTDAAGSGSGDIYSDARGGGSNNGGVSRALRSLHRSLHTRSDGRDASEPVSDSHPTSAGTDCAHGRGVQRFSDAVVRPPRALLALMQSDGVLTSSGVGSSREQWEAAIDFVSRTESLAHDQIQVLPPELDFERLSNAPLRWPPLVTLDLSQSFYTAVHHSSLAAASQYRSNHPSTGRHQTQISAPLAAPPISLPTYRVVAAGLSRSGSTWQFNCLRFILRAAFGDYSLPAVTASFRSLLTAQSATPTSDPAKIKSIDFLRSQLIELERAVKTGASSVPESVGLSEFTPASKPEWAGTAYDPANQRSAHYPVAHPRLLDCLYNATVCVVKVHGLVPEIPHIADGIFTTHRDVRDLVSSIRHLWRGPDRTQWHNFGPPYGAPTDSTTFADGQSYEFNNLKNAFSWYTRWVPLSLYDMEYEDLMSDELFEIRMHIRLLGFREATEPFPPSPPPPPPAAMNSEFVSRVSSILADDSDSMPSLSPQTNQRRSGTGTDSRDGDGGDRDRIPPTPIAVDPVLVQRLIHDSVSHARRSDGWQSGSGLHTRHVSDHRHLLRDLTAYELRELEYHYGEWLRWKQYPIYYPDFAGSSGSTGTGSSGSSSGSGRSSFATASAGGSGFVQRMRRKQQQQQKQNSPHRSDARRTATAASGVTTTTTGQVSSPASTEVNTRANVMQAMPGHHLLWQTRNQTTLLSEWNDFLRSQYNTRYERADTLSLQLAALQRRKDTASQMRRIC